MKRIGVLYPSGGYSEGELHKILPDGVSLHVTRIPMAKNPTYEVGLHMADNVEDPARLLADARVDIIAFSCTLGSFIKGKGYDQEIMNRITQATGIPATTMTTAVVAGLRVLDIKKLVMVAPYVDRIIQTEKAFLEDEGMQMLNYRGLGLDDVDDMYNLEPSYWYNLVKKMREPKADGYFMSCGGVRVVDIIEQLEADLGKPVVSSNQAMVWHCLRKIGIQEPRDGFGRLLKTPLRE